MKCLLRIRHRHLPPPSMLEIMLEIACGLRGCAVNTNREYSEFAPGISRRLHATVHVRNLQTLNVILRQMRQEGFTTPLAET